MNRKLLTDIELRAKWYREPTKVIYVPDGVMLTPAARDFIAEHGLVMEKEKKLPEMTVEKTLPDGAKGRYVIAATGKRVDQKPEEMTHLHGNILVPKTHPRIAFRGKIDSLMADFLCLQEEANEAGETELALALGSLLDAVRSILAAEVKDEPLGELRMLDMDSETLRRMSHDLLKNFGVQHPIPSADMGRLCLALNRLRTRSREAELAAAHAFERENGFERQDILEAMNRLSSAIYILFIRQWANRRKGGTDALSE